MIVAGIMTGTSVDGVDVAICDIQKKSDRHAITLLSFYSRPINEEMREQITNAIEGRATMSDLNALPFNIARMYAHAVDEALKNVSTGSLPELIGAHGQTIYHEPPTGTWQSLSGSALAALTRTTVVHDFRSADVAMGGQGAPLVPMFDVAMLQSESVDRVALNIGGIANITLLPSKNGGDTVGKRTKGIERVIAFDVGPGNVLIDAASQLYYGKAFDDNGSIARAGIVAEPLLNEFKNHPYFSAEPPKSTGREMFNKQMLEHIGERYRASLRPAEDMVCTMTELTAWCIADHIRRYQPKTQEVIVSGGGSKNSYLIERIRQLLPLASCLISDEVGIPSQAKEAMAFAYLAWRTVNNLPGNFPSVTGASEPVVLGSISKPLA